MGVMQPFAGPYTDLPTSLENLGIEWSKGIVVTQPFIPGQKFPFLVAWNKQWQTWEKPYNELVHKWPLAVLYSHIVPTYWMMDVVRRAGSTDPEKIIAVWEGDEYQRIDGSPLKMRACDHRQLTPAYVTALTHPNQWYDHIAGHGEVTVIPAEDHVVPPPDMERCK
jgi:branched-chain amino acid transport system substrate-binding protein